MAKALASFNLMAHIVASKRHQHNRPMIMSMSHNNSYNWTSVNDDVEAYLKQAVVVKEPLEVYEPMRHFVFAAPVNMAPALCIAACEFVGGRREHAMAAAAALHVMHAASFVHENLPLSNRPSLIPKSKPMMYHVFGPNVELMIADGMIPFGLELLADSDNPAQNISDQILRAIVEMTRGIGSQGLIERQYCELQQCSQYADKEGWLHACGGACGAILGGGSEEEIEVLRRYGYHVGMIQGMSRRLGFEKEVEELKEKAIKEMKSLNEKKFEIISSFIEV